MTPDIVLSRVLSVDPVVGKFLLGGLGLFACAALVLGFSIDFETLLVVAGYLVAFCAIIAVLGRLAADSLLSTVVGWIAAALFAVWASAILASAVVRDSPLTPPPCIIRFWEPCAQLEDRIAEGKMKEQNLPDVKPAEVVVAANSAIATLEPTAKATVSNHKVYIQFAGVISRESITSLATGLKQGGWKVQGQSGERIKTAAGLNEVRFLSEADREVAEALAKAIADTQIVSAQIVAKQNGAIAPNALEVWISR